MRFAFSVNSFLGIIRSIRDLRGSGRFLGGFLGHVNSEVSASVDLRDLGTPLIRLFVGGIRFSEFVFQEMGESQIIENFRLAAAGGFKVPAGRCEVTKPGFKHRQIGLSLAEARINLCGLRQILFCDIPAACEVATVTVIATKVGAVSSS
jgi:hypothetical protein